MAKVALVTSGLEHLGLSALSAYARARGHEPVLVYEPRPFSSDSGPNSAVLARLCEPTPAETAARIVAAVPDVVAFSSYTITHRWAVAVAREVKRRLAAPVVFGGPHVSGAPAHAIREPAIDAVVQGEGEEALVDLLECAERGRFGRRDVPNCWFKGDGRAVGNPCRPLIRDLDRLPFGDKQGFYDEVPALEREYAIVAQRGCPFRCSFCEYSLFPRLYPGERSVRRRSVRHVIDELTAFRRRGRMRKVFFWDAIFTLDRAWLEEFAEAYRAAIGLPFECYTHPQVLSRDMARLLARAGCALVRIGVQTVNPRTLRALNRRGDEARVRQAFRHLADAGVPCAVDHMLGLPGESPADQRAAVRLYNAGRPRRINLHWMTYLPGTEALEEARREGALSAAEVERVLTGEQREGYEAPRLAGRRAGDQPALAEVRRLAVLFDLIPLLPRAAVDWLLESGAYRLLPRDAALRRAAAGALALGGDPATRARLRAILAGAAWSAGTTWRRRLRGRARATPARDGDRGPGRAFRSLCDVCLRDVPAEIVPDGARVLQRKRCPEHGVREVLASENGADYLRLERAYHRIFPPAAPPPASIDTYFFLTNSCNQGCAFCATEANRYPYFEDYDEQEFAAALATYAGAKVSLIGGEPLSHPRFFRFAEAVARTGKTLVVYTNGIALGDEAFVRRLVATVKKLEVRMTFEGFRAASYRHLPVPGLRELKLAALGHLERHGVPTVLGHTLDVGEGAEEAQEDVRALVQYAMTRDFVRGLTFQGAVPLGGARHRTAAETLSVDQVMDRLVAALPIPVARRDVYLTQKLVYFMAHRFRLPICAYVQAALVFRAGGRWVGLDHFFDCARLDARLDRRVRDWDRTARAPLAALFRDLLLCARPGRLPALGLLALRLVPVFRRKYDFASIPKAVLPLLSITICDRYNFDASVARRCEKSVHTRVGGEVVTELCSEMAIRHLRERTAAEAAAGSAARAAAATAPARVGGPLR